MVRSRLMTWAATVVRRAVAAHQAVMAGLFTPRPKRYYHIGDIAPDSLLNREPGTNIGAFVSVDPETRRITNIFAP